MAVEASSHWNWKDLTSATKDVKGNSLKLTVSTQGDITKDGSMITDDTIDKVVAGYAWVEGAAGDDGKVRGFVVAIHPDFRDSNQNPDAWHSHSVALTPRPNGYDFCLAGEDLGTTQAGITIKGSEIKLSTLKNSGVNADALAAATSFTIWDPIVTNGGCADGELLVRANGIFRGTAVGITG